MMTKKCDVCGSSYEVKKSKAGRRKYCSRKCFGISLLKREDRVCVVCGEVFESGGRSGHARGQQTCSKECGRKTRYRHGRICNTLSREEAAYLAGFWDADGSVILYLHRPGSVSFRLSVAGTKPKVIQWIAEVTGIGSPVFYPSTNPNHADRWQWHVNGDGAESFAKQLIPYLRLKRLQAELGVRFQERLRDPALKADLVWQQEYREIMGEMNKRGKVEEG